MDHRDAAGLLPLGLKSVFHSARLEQCRPILDDFEVWVRSPSRVEYRFVMVREIESSDVEAHHHLTVHPLEPFDRLGHAFSREPLASRVDAHALQTSLLVMRRAQAHRVPAHRGPAHSAPASAGSQACARHDQGTLLPVVRVGVAASTVSASNPAACQTGSRGGVKGPFPVSHFASEPWKDAGSVRFLEICGDPATQ